MVPVVSNVFAKYFADDARGIAATAVLCFVFSWTEFILTILCEYHPDDTDQSDDFQFMDIRYSSALHDSNVAKLIFILLFQRFLVRGLTVGAQILTFPATGSKVSGTHNLGNLVKPATSSGLAILNASAFCMHFEDHSNIKRTLFRGSYKFVDKYGIEYREVD